MLLSLTVLGISDSQCSIKRRGGLQASVIEKVVHILHALGHGIFLISSFFAALTLFCGGIHLSKAEHSIFFMNTGFLAPISATLAIQLSIVLLLLPSNCLALQTKFTSFSLAACVWFALGISQEVCISDPLDAREWTSPFYTVIFFELLSKGKSEEAILTPLSLPDAINSVSCYATANTTPTTVTLPLK